MVSTGFLDDVVPGWERVQVMVRNNAPSNYVAIGSTSRIVAKCEAHLKAEMDALMKQWMVRLDNTALLFDMLAQKRIHAAQISSKAVYVSLVLPVQGQINAAQYTFQFSMEKYTTRSGDIGLSISAYPSTRMKATFIAGILRTMSPLIYSVLLAVFAIATNSACKKAYQAVISTNTYGTELVYQFCDNVRFEMQLEYGTHITDSIAQPEALAPITMALKTGAYNEIEAIPTPTVAVKERMEAEKKLKTEAEKKEAEANAMKSYMNGEHRILFDWTEDQKKRIVPKDFLRSFVPVPEFFRLMRKLESRIGKTMTFLCEMGITNPEAMRSDVVNLLLYGNPGTGKTVLAHALSAATGMPLYEVKFDRYTESDEIEGKNKIVNGQLAFTQTDFLEGYERGGIILMEEINCADQNMITGTLNNAIEYPFFVMKNGYEKVTRHPMTVLIGTMNVGTEGTMWLNQAFASRFKQKYRISDPSKEDFIQFLKNAGPYDAYTCTYVYEAYEKVKGMLESNRSTADYVMNLSTRACIGALENIADGDDPKMALTDTIVGAIGIVDPKTAESIEKNVIANLPNYRPPKQKK